MLNLSLPENSNYNFVVVRINNLTNLEGLDRLKGTNIFGNQVLVGSSTQIGDLGIYFPIESQLGLHFCEVNDLIRRKDENGKPAGGMFDSNRRVRCQRFKGHPSMGFWIPLSSLNYLNIDLPSEGTSSSEWGGEIISTKYIPKTNSLSERTSLKFSKPKESRIVDNQFKFHFDTPQLGREVNKLNLNDNIYITFKLHGTSAISSNVLCKQPRKWWEKLFNIPYKVKYEYVYASRRVIKNEFIENKNHFYGYDLWTEVGTKFFEGKLHKGETIYYEIVGYTKEGNCIQKDFDYKCFPGNCSIYVYRITMTNSEGIITELQFNQVMERCKELGISHVPLVYYGTIFNFLQETKSSFDERNWREVFIETLKKKFVNDSNSIFCNNPVPEEGICVRRDGLNIDIFKLKSFRFLEYETKNLDKGEIDLETQETLSNSPSHDFFIN